MEETNIITNNIPNTEEQIKTTFSSEEVEAIKSEQNDKYLRLLAEFDNYKKRTVKDKEDLKNSVKEKMLHSILELDSDLTLASKNVEMSEGLTLIMSKLTGFLKSQGVEEIQTHTYDADLHEVISVLETGENKILDVLSKGYTLNGVPFKYPKIVLSK